MAGMLEYKCPCCDGAIQFDSATQKMKCPYCDTEFDVDTLKGYDEELKDEKPSEMEWATPGGSWAEGETAGLHTYSCKSCGGEIVGDDTMAASACPFCGNPIVLTGQFAGMLRPDLIIPFKLDKKAAKAKLLGVDPTLIEQYNVVSGPVAVAMAYGALQASGADLAVGITGIAGPGGALPDKPVGTVYLAGADARSGKAWLMRLELGGYAERSIIRTRAALYALDLLRRMALDIPPENAHPVPSKDVKPETLDI